MPIPQSFLTLQKDLDMYMKGNMPNCTVRLSDKKGMEVIGAPQEISKAYNMAQTFLLSLIHI